MFEKVSQSLKYDSNFFLDHKHVIYRDTKTNHFTQLALRVRGNEGRESATKTASEATVPDLATQSATITFEYSISQTGHSGSYSTNFIFKGIYSSNLIEALPKQKQKPVSVI